MYRLLLCTIAIGLLSGCGSSQRYTQAQLNAIETRDVDASMNETFNAASGALFDAGYTIAMSDRQGGLLTGSKATDRSAQRYWISHYIEDTKFTVSIQIRESGPKTCTVRVKTSVNGAPKVDKAAIDELWVLMQRQVLMKEVLPTEVTTRANPPTPAVSSYAKQPNIVVDASADRRIPQATPAGTSMTKPVASTASQAYSQQAPPVDLGLESELEKQKVAQYKAAEAAFGSADGQLNVVSVTELRGRYQQYSSWSDAALAKSVYDKYYSLNMPEAEFNRRFLGTGR